MSWLKAFDHDIIMVGCMVVIYSVAKKHWSAGNTAPNIIKFTYYHHTSIDYSVHYEWSTLYFECST